MHKKAIHFMITVFAAVNLRLQWILYNNNDLNGK